MQSVRGNAGRVLRPQRPSLRYRSAAYISRRPKVQRCPAVSGKGGASCDASGPRSARPDRRPGSNRLSSPNRLRERMRRLAGSPSSGVLLSSQDSPKRDGRKTDCEHRWNEIGIIVENRTTRDDLLFVLLATTHGPATAMPFEPLSLLVAGYLAQRARVTNGGADPSRDIGGRRPDDETGPESTRIRIAPKCPQGRLKYRAAWREPCTPR